MKGTTDPLEMALAQLIQERNDLDVAISALQKRLGRQVNTPAIAASGAAAASAPAGEVVTYHGEFHSLPLTKATEQLLHRVGRPLKTPQILKALQSASFEIRSKTPRSSLYTTLKRSPLFVKVLPDTWDLAERHPQAAERKREETAKARKSKARKGSNDRKPLAVTKTEQDKAVA